MAIKYLFGGGRRFVPFIILVLLQLQLQPMAARNHQTQSKPSSRTGSGSAGKTDDSQAQNPAPTPNQDVEAVVRISTQLVQIDAIVTDKKGNHIEDLSPADFEMLVDEKPQPLTYFKRIVLYEAPEREKAQPNVNEPTLTQMPTRQIEEQNVRRTIALIVDDLNLSFSSVAFAKASLKDFVANQMREGDLVGIFRTSGGLGIYQQFTSDKRILYAAINKIVFPLNGVGVGAFAMNFESPKERNGVFNTPAEKARERMDNPQKAAAERVAENAENFRETIFLSGTMGALNYVTRSLRPLPGRKVAIALSDGLSPKDPGFFARVRNLIELANRSGVAFYSVNVKGQQVPGWTDAAFESAGQQRDSGESGINDVLRTLAYETGGLALYDNNDTAELLKRSADDNRSYYLVGFDPEDEKFDQKFHKIRLRVNRPGLTVRTRNGFFGLEDAKAREIPKTREDQIKSALFSPFGTKDIPYQVTSLFYSSLTGQPVIRSFFHIDPKSLKFKDEAGGEKSTTLELVYFSFDERGMVAESYAQQFTIRLNSAQFTRVMAEGLTYLNDFPVKKPGAYQLRSVLRDANSGRLGSSHQFIQIPSLKKDRIALSGIILNQAVNGEPARPVNAAAQNENILEAEIIANPAVRRFATDSEIEYQASIYNPRPEKNSQAPSVTLRFELYREGKQIFQSPERPVRNKARADGKEAQWLDCGGRFQLRNFSAGEYYLRLIVRDEQRQGKNAAAEQWIDFSVR